MGRVSTQSWEELRWRRLARQWRESGGVVCPQRTDETPPPSQYVKWMHSAASANVMMIEVMARLERLGRCQMSVNVVRRPQLVAGGGARIRSRKLRVAKSPVATGRAAWRTATMSLSAGSKHGALPGANPKGRAERRILRRVRSLPPEVRDTIG